MALVRTSESDPIRVAWLPLPGPGRVGLTFAPGKHQDLPLSGHAWRRDLTQDLTRLTAEYRTDVLVSLLEDHEYDALRIPNLLAEAAGRGWQVKRLPIKDGGVPTQQADVVELIAVILQAVLIGRNVVIHCMGGLGRAGTVGGCVLVASGMSPDQALHSLKEARGTNCPETDAQRQFIRSFAAVWSGEML